MLVKSRKTTIFSLHSDSFEFTLSLPKIKGFPKTWELIVEFVIFISKTIVFTVHIYVKRNQI